MKAPFSWEQPFRLLLGGVVATVLVVGSPAIAQVAPPFDELLKQTLNAPRRAVLDAEVDRARGLAEQAGARPNPTVSAYVENFAGTSPYGGLNRSETTFQVNQPLELGGKRSARIAAGEAGVAAARAKSAEGRLTYASELADAYAAAEVSQRRVQRAEHEVEEAEAVLKLTRVLVNAGKEARLRQLQAETAVDTEAAALETARANNRRALDRLSALAGFQQPFASVQASLLSNSVQGGATGALSPSSTAAYRTATAEREAAALRVVVERKRAIPDITAQLGVRRLQGDKAIAVVAGVSVPLHVFDRNRGNIAAAQAELRAAEARVQLAQIEAQANFRSAIAQAEAADARVTAARKTMATAQETYRLARIGYEAGKAALIELLTARQGLGTAMDVVIDTEFARFEARLALARLYGLTITGDSVQ